jgi:hypothetical protein
MKTGAAILFFDFQTGHPETQANAMLAGGR